MRQTIVASRGRAKGEWHRSEHYQRLEMFGGQKSPSITSISKDYMLLEIYEVRANRSWREQRKAVVTSEGEQYKSIWEAGTRMAQRYGCKASTARKEIRKAIRIHKPRYGRMWRFDEERIKLKG